MTKKNGIRLAIVFTFLLLYAALLYYANRGWNGYVITESTGIEYETAKVLQVIEDNTVIDENIEGRRRGSMLLELELVQNYTKRIWQIRNT